MCMSLTLCGARVRREDGQADTVTMTHSDSTRHSSGLGRTIYNIRNSLYSLLALGDTRGKSNLYTRYISLQTSESRLANDLDKSV